MRILGAVVLSKSLLMRAAQAELPERGAVRTQLVRDEQFRQALLAEQLAHEPDSSLSVATPLNQHLEDLTLMVDGTPQVHPSAGNPDDHLVEVPQRTRAPTALLQLAGDPRAKFQHPAPDRFVGDIKAALSKQLLDIAIADREPKIEPDRVLNHGRREAMAAVQEQSHSLTIRLSAFSASVSVTMPGAINTEV